MRRGLLGGHRIGVTPLLVGIIALHVLGVAAAGLWWGARPTPAPQSPPGAEAAPARSIRIAEQAAAVAHADLSLGLLLGLEAYHIWPTPEAFRTVVGSLEAAEQRPLMATIRRGIGDLALGGNGSGETLAALGFDPQWVLERARAGEGLPARPGVITLWRMSGIALTPAAAIGGGELVSSVAVRGDAKVVAAGSASSPIVKLWTAADEARPALRDLGEALVTAVAFDPGGTMLASGTQHGVIRLSRQREPMRYVLARTLRHRHNSAVTTLAFSPASSRVLASASADRTVALWHLDSDTPPAFLGQPAAGRPALAFSREGRVLATVGLEAVLRLWDVRTAAPLAEMPAPAPLSALAFSADDASLAAGGVDGQVRFYRRRLDWTEVAPASPAIVLGREPVTSLQFSRDGRVLAVGTESRLVLVDAGLASWASRACRLAGRELTAEERSSYLPDAPSGPARCSQLPD